MFRNALRSHRAVTRVCCRGRAEESLTYFLPSSNSSRPIHTFSDDLLNDIQVFSRKRRSTVGIKALLETGRGEYLKNFEMGLKQVDRGGTVKEKVLIQVASFLHRHYLALRNSTNFSADCPLAMVGLIDEKASPYAIALSAIEDAKYMCTRTHGDAPEVELRGRLDLTLPQIPDHIQYILLELLKNSMRATVEHHGVDNAMPPIKVIIADGEDNEDVVIKVSDEGGGIKRSNMNKIWSYLFTTADRTALDNFISASALDSELSQTDHNTASPLAGLGYGLPISRCYARHFGGDLTLMSMEGYGTDGYVYLSRI